MRHGADVRVLQSFKKPSPRTNPYIAQLLDSLAATDGVQPHCFTWRHALVGRYDVFHAHWPESLIEQRGAFSTFGRRAAYTLLLLRLWLLGIPVVRTVHNLELPHGISWFDRHLLLATERLTRARVVLNEFTPVPEGSTSVLIEHGHYRDWFAPFDRPDPVPGRVVFFGKIRRYKNVEGLVRAFRAMPETHPPSTLAVLGAPSSEELVGSLRDACGADERIDLVLGHVDDSDLVRAVGAAELVVLPYPEMHNSGSVLAALSLSRPVLVPDNAFNRALAIEVGEQWIYRYEGALDPTHLLEALDRVSKKGRQGAPDLRRREWGGVGQRHLSAYRQAIGECHLT